MNNTLIQISRSQYVEVDRSIAILRLDQHLFEVGEPVQVRYYLDEEQTEIDTILAMGIRKGYGKDCYRILSLGGLELVRDVVSELPDVSSLVHGEVYLYQNPLDAKWYYVYALGESRQMEEIVGSPRTFVNINDRYRWFWKDGDLKREDDFYNSSHLTGIIEEVLNLIHRPTLEVYCLDGNLFRAGESKIIDLKIQVTNYKGEDITQECQIKIDDRKVNLGTNNCCTITGLEYNHDFHIVAEYSVNGSVISVDSWIRVRFGYDIYYGIIGGNSNPTEDENFALVTSVSQLENSNICIITNNQFTKALGKQNTNHYREAVDINITDTNSFTPDNSEIYEISLEKVGTRYSLRCSDGYLYASGKTANNYLDVTSSLPEDSTGLASISVDINGDTSIIFDGNSSTIKNNLQYNIQNPRFTCYSTSQGGIRLFKKKSSTNNLEGEWEPTEKNVKNLENVELRTRENTTWYGINLENQKIVYATPKAYGLLTHIYDANKLDYIDDYDIYEIEINTIPYYVYVKKDAIQITDFTQRFVYIAEDTTDELRYGGVLDDIIRAWKEQNMENGLVVLEGNGKIPEYLLPDSVVTSSDSYIPLAGIVDSYPAYGMKVGEIYYNETTKKLYRATSSESGVISSPIEGRLYVDTPDKTTYIWQGGELVNIGGSIMSTKINNLTDIL